MAGGFLYITKRACPLTKGQNTQPKRPQTLCRTGQGKAPGCAVFSLLIRICFIAMQCVQAQSALFFLGKNHRKPVALPQKRNFSFEAGLWRPMLRSQGRKSVQTTARMRRALAPLKAFAVDFAGAVYHHKTIRVDGFHILPQIVGLAAPQRRKHDGHVFMRVGAVCLPNRGAAL